MRANPRIRRIWRNSAGKTASSGELDHEQAPIHRLSAPSRSTRSGGPHPPCRIVHHLRLGLERASPPPTHQPTHPRVKVKLVNRPFICRVTKAEAGCTQLKSSEPPPILPHTISLCVRAKASPRPQATAHNLPTLSAANRYGSGAG